jgi:succinate dehydrogenase/fumarate reductase-like Fe-S protein
MKKLFTKLIAIVKWHLKYKKEFENACEEGKCPSDCGM